MALEIAMVVAKMMVGYMLSTDERVVTVNLPLRKTHTAAVTIKFPTKVSTLIDKNPVMDFKVEINGQTLVSGRTCVDNLPVEKNFFYDSHEVVFTLKMISNELTVGFKYRKSDSSSDFYDDDDDDNNDGDFDPAGIGGKGYDPHKYDFILDKIRKKY